MVIAVVLSVLLILSVTARKQDVVAQTADAYVAVPATSPYAPVGTLANEDGRVLQLYARPCGSHRDRWNYHTMVDESRIPVELTFRGRRCENDRIGCDRVYSGDSMTATEFGTQAPLRVQLYDQ